MAIIDMADSTVLREVVVVSNDFPPVHGGIQRYISALASELARRRYAVSVIAPARAGAEAFDSGVPYEVARYRGTSLPAHFIGMFATLLRRRINRPQPAFTVASLWFPAGLAVMLLPRRLRGRVIVLVHGAELKPSHHGFRRRLMTLVLERADAVIANSTFTASLIAKCGIDRKIGIVHCGVDAQLVERRPSGTPIVLAVGRLVARKGFDRLLEALPAVFQAIPEARCEIAGDGPQRESLKRAASELGISERVSFLGAVSDEGLRDAYARAWCFALPVRNDGDDVEGFGIVYLEAAMASLPTIGGVASGAEDAIADGETGTLVDGSDSTAVAAAIIEMLSDTERSRAMGERGRRRAVEEFTWSRCADGILEAIG